MTRQEQLRFCSVCSHRQMDMKQGIVCGLTGAKADFEDACPQYELDPAQAAKEEEKARKTEEAIKNAAENPRMRGATLFLFVGIISLVNLILELVGIRLIFGLGITTALHSLWGTAGLILSAVVCIAFMVLSYLANRKEAEWAYRLAFFGYLADSVLMVLLLILSMSYIRDNIFHLVVLLCTYPLHPFYSKAIREKAKAEVWSPLRIAMTVIMGVLIAGTLGMGLTIRRGVHEARDNRPLNELKASVAQTQARMEGTDTSVALVGDSAVHLRYDVTLDEASLALLRARKELMNEYIKEYMLLSYFGMDDPFLQNCVQAKCGLVMKWYCQGEELYSTSFSVRELATMYLGKHGKTADAVWKRLIAEWNKVTPVDFDGDTFKLIRAERKDKQVILYAHSTEKVSAARKKVSYLESAAQYFCSLGNDPLVRIVQMNKQPVYFHFTSDKEPSWSEEVAVKK